MAEKPTTAQEYSSDQSKLVRETCLYVATIIGDYMEDIVIVEGGKIRNIEEVFAAVITPGLMLAFSDRKKITLSGTTIKAETATRDIWVCGPGSFVVLKALAFRNRRENKDAYDLYYHIRNYGEGVQNVAIALKQLLQEKEAKRALQILNEDFTEHDGVGAVRVAQFITGGKDAGIQADVIGFVRQLIDLCS